MVIATTGGGYEAGDIDNLALELIKAYNKNENYSNQLDSIIKDIESPETQNAEIDNFPFSYLNKTFQFEMNDLKLKSIRFEQRN
jgi:hypothetical protein